MFSNCGVEKTLESPLDNKEMKPVNPKGNQPWIFIGRTDAEAEAPILWPPDAKNRLTGKDPDAGKDWRQEEKGTTEDEMVGWHHWLNGHEFEQAPADGEGQGSLACYSPWSHKESGTTEGLINSRKMSSKPQSTLPLLLLLLQNRHHCFLGFSPLKKNDDLSISSMDFNRWVKGSEHCYGSWFVRSNGA